MSLQEKIFDYVAPTILNIKFLKKYFFGKVDYTEKEIVKIYEFIKNNTKEKRGKYFDYREQQFNLRTISCLNEFSLEEMLFLIDKGIDLDGIKLIYEIKNSKNLFIIKWDNKKNSYVKLKQFIPKLEINKRILINLFKLVTNRLFYKRLISSVFIMILLTIAFVLLVFSLSLLMNNYFDFNYQILGVKIWRLVFLISVVFVPLFIFISTILIRDNAVIALKKILDSKYKTIFEPINEEK